MSLNNTLGIIEQQRPPAPPTIEDTSYSYEHTTAELQHAHAMPGTEQVGDLLVTIATAYYVSSGLSITTATSGWDKEYQYGSTSNDCYIAVFSKPAVASEPDIEIDASVAVYWKVRTYRISGAALTNPVLHRRTSYYKPTSQSLHLLLGGRVTEPYTLELAVSLITNVAVGPHTLADARGYTLENADYEGTGDRLALGIASKQNGKEPPVNFHGYPPVFGLASGSNYRYNAVHFTVRSKDALPPGQINLIYRSRDLRATDSGNLYECWADANSPGTGWEPTLDQDGFDGVANTATRVKDNSSNLHETKYRFPDYDTLAGPVMCAKIWLMKEDPPAYSSVPAFGLRSWQGTSSYTGNAWLKVDQTDGSYQAGATPADTSFGVQEYTDSMGQVWYGVMIETPKITGSRDNVGLHIWPAYATTVAGSSSSSLWGDITIGGVELYQNCTIADIENNPPNMTDPRGPGSGYLVYFEPEGRTGADVVDTAGSNNPQIGPAPVYASGSSVFIDSTNMIYSTNGGHWPWYDAGEADVKAIVYSDYHMVSNIPLVTCRGGGPGNINAYAARIISMTSASPVLEIWRCSAGSWAVVAATQVTMTSEGPLRQYQVELSIASDSAGVYASATVNGTTYNTSKLTTEWNTNTYCGFYISGTSGNYWPRLRKFTVEDYP